MKYQHFWAKKYIVRKHYYINFCTFKTPKLNFYYQK